MSAKKLGRAAGLVLVLAAFFGGASLQPPSTGGAAATQVKSQIIDWS